MQKAQSTPQNQSRCHRCDGMVVLIEDHGATYFHCLICGRDRDAFQDPSSEVADVPGDGGTPRDIPSGLDEGGETPDPVGAEGRSGGAWYPVTDAARDRYRRIRETMFRHRLSIEKAMDLFHLSRRTIYRILDGENPADCDADENMGPGSKEGDDRPPDTDLGGE